MSEIPADQVTHINYAFANLSPTGEVVLGDPWADVEKAYPGDTWDQPLRGNFNQLNKLKQRHPHLKTLISVGGWTWSENFSDAALAPESRARFARSAVDFASTTASTALTSTGSTRSAAANPTTSTARRISVTTHCCWPNCAANSTTRVAATQSSTC